MKILRALSLMFLVCAAAAAQNAALLPVVRPQFLDANGVPLVGGYLYTCTAGTTCLPAFVGDPPVNPLATFTDSTGSVANANPIVLDSAGRAGVWLGSGTYKLVLQDANGVTQWSQDNVSSLSLKSVTTSGAVSNFNVPGTLTVGSITASGTISGKLRDFVSVKDFGAKCDGSTDDTTALQAALTWGMANASTVLIPSGTCVYSTTLNGNSTTTGVHIVGKGAIGAGASVLKYTGTGSALLYKNTTGNKFVYNAQIEGVSIVVSGAATYGIEGYIISEGYFKDIFIGPVGAGTLQTAIYCGSQGVAFTGCNIITFQHAVIQGTTSHAVVMINPAAITFRDDDFYQIKGANFALNGAITQFNVVDGWQETTDIGVLLDDSLSTDLLAVIGLKVEGTRFLFNGGTATYPNQVIFKANTSAGRVSTIYNLVFRDINAYFPFSLTSTSYPFQVNWNASTSAGSFISAEVSNTALNGTLNTGAWFNVSGAPFQSWTQLSFRNVYAFDQNNNPLYKEVNGSANYQDSRQFNESFSVGRNNQKSGSTMTLQDNDATNGGKTNLALYAGVSQSTSSLLSVFDASGNYKTSLDNSTGMSFSPGLGVHFTNASGSNRWWEITQTTETGSNAGSNWTLNSYTDAGGFLASPLVVIRSTGQVQVGGGGILDNGALTMPTIKAGSGTRFLCIDSAGLVVSQTTACSGT